MTNEEKILQILGQIQTDVLSIKEVLAEHTEILNEHTEILSDQTTALNELIRWADDAQVVVKIPFAQAK